MARNKQALPGANPKGLGKCGVDGRDQQLQYAQNPRFIQFRDNPEAYRRAVRRMMADAFVTLRQFPARLRFSYYVDRKGKLRPLTERRAAG